MKVRYGLVKVADILAKLVRNPNYGGPKVGYNGWVSQPFNPTDKPVFQEALSDSVSKEGIRNPILVLATDSGDYLCFGGSRLKAMREGGIDCIPAIINDHAGRYEDCAEVTPDNWEQFFTDVPRYAEFSADGFDYHYFLERNRGNEFDPAGIAWGAPLGEFPWIEEQE